MKQLALVSLVSVSMVMSGCAATQQAAQNNSPAKNAGLGALAGAILGAGVSKATGGEKTGRDAAIGAAIGAGVGAYMSRQARQIQTQMAGTGVEVTQDQRTGNINLVMPGNITFAYDDATLNPSSPKRHTGSPRGSPRRRAAEYRWKRATRARGYSRPRRAGSRLLMAWDHPCCVHGEPEKLAQHEDGYQEAAGKERVESEQGEPKNRTPPGGGALQRVRAE